MFKFIYETETTRVYELKLNPEIQKVVNKTTGRAKYRKEVK